MPKTDFKTEVDFKKMHGLGNDFIIVDSRNSDKFLTQKQILALSDRRTGIGCDQFVQILAAKHDKAYAFLDMYNGLNAEKVGACGNASRCVADMLMKETGKGEIVLQSPTALLSCSRAENEMVKVNMGPARTQWQDIPLIAESDAQSIDVGFEDMPTGVCVNMGNPHIVFFVENAASIDVSTLGPQIENHAIFPEKTNVEFVHMVKEQVLRMRVWERDTGITQACGSGACAAAVAAILKGYVKPQDIEVVLDGGSLFITWDRAQNNVLMTGPVSYVFDGTIEIR